MSFVCIDVHVKPHIYRHMYVYVCMYVCVHVHTYIDMKKYFFCFIHFYLLSVSHRFTYHRARNRVRMFSLLPLLRVLNSYLTTTMFFFHIFFLFYIYYLNVRLRMHSGIQSTTILLEER